jgi:hypothetical protein
MLARNWLWLTGGFGGLFSLLQGDLHPFALGDVVYSPSK